MLIGRAETERTKVREVGAKKAVHYDQDSYQLMVHAVVVVKCDGGQEASVEDGVQIMLEKGLSPVLAGLVAVVAQKCGQDHAPEEHPEVPVQTHVLPEELPETHGLPPEPVLLPRPKAHDR